MPQMLVYKFRILTQYVNASAFLWKGRSENPRGAGLRGYLKDNNEISPRSGIEVSESAVFRE
jgi:hypothetical protein